MTINREAVRDTVGAKGSASVPSLSSFSVSYFFFGGGRDGGANSGRLAASGVNKRRPSKFQRFLYLAKQSIKYEGTVKTCSDTQGKEKPPENTK